MQHRHWNWIVIGIMAGCSTAYAAEPSKGEAIYNKACTACHSPAVAPALKSPQVHDVAAWDARKKTAEEAIKTKPEFKTALDYLVSQVKNGYKAMPPKGTCTDCTDEDFKAAIEFMSSK